MSAFVPGEKMFNQLDVIFEPTYIKILVAQYDKFIMEIKSLFQINLKTRMPGMA